MSGAIAYACISTVGRESGNKVMEIEAAGFIVEPDRIVLKTFSGSTAAAQRNGHSRPLDLMSKGDFLVVTKLDRLARDPIAVSGTVADLEDMGLRVRCLALGRVDLIGFAKMMTMNVINAAARFGRYLAAEPREANGGQWRHRVNRTVSRLGRRAWQFGCQPVEAVENDCVTYHGGSTAKKGVTQEPRDALDVAAAVEAGQCREIWAEPAALPHDVANGSRSLTGLSHDKVETTLFRLVVRPDFRMLAPRACPVEQGMPAGQTRPSI